MKTKAFTYAGDGLRRTKTSPDGTVTTLTWDRSAAVPLLLAAAIDAPGTATDRTVRYVYDPGGTFTFAYVANATTVTDPALKVTRHEFANGLCTATVRNPGASESRWTYVLDGETLGRLCYTAATDSAACGSAPSDATTFTFDGRGNRTKATRSGFIFLPLDLQGHGVNTSSGSASLGRLSMAAFQSAFGWSNVPIAAFNTGSGVVNAFSACLGISGAHYGGSAFSSVVGFHSVLGNMFGLPFVSNFYNALSNFMGAAPWGQGDC